MKSTTMPRGEDCGYELVLLLCRGGVDKERGELDYCVYRNNSFGDLRRPARDDESQLPEL